MARFTQILRTHPAVSLLCFFAVIGSALAGAMLIHAQAASASLSQCSSGQFCVWTNTNETGTFYHFDNSIGTNQWVTLTDPPGDLMGSAYNDRTNVVHLGECSSSECSTPPPTGSKDCMIAGGERDNLGNFNFPDGTNEQNHVGFIDLGGAGASC